jgi:hypothetical protein
VSDSSEGAFADIFPYYLLKPIIAVLIPDRRLCALQHMGLDVCISNVFLLVHVMAKEN